jgi:hypothetical protein
MNPRRGLCLGKFVSDALPLPTALFPSYKRRFPRGSACVEVVFQHIVGGSGVPAGIAGRSILHDEETRPEKASLPWLAPRSQFISKN